MDHSSPAPSPRHVEIAYSAPRHRQAAEALAAEIANGHRPQQRQHQRPSIAITITVLAAAALLLIAIVSTG